jgi:hypothetical protein
MPSQVHPSVKRMEARLAQAMPDRLWAHSDREQLSAAYDPVLRRRERRDHLVAASPQIAHW